MSDITPIYKYTLAEAKKGGEQEITRYCASHMASIDCAIAQRGRTAERLARQNKKHS